MDKQKYRFFGRECNIDGVAKLSNFGQAIELSDSEARDVTHGGGSLLLADDFVAIFGDVSVRPSGEKALIEFDRAVVKYRELVELLTEPTKTVAESEGV